MHSSHPVPLLPLPNTQSLLPSHPASGLGPLASLTFRSLLFSAVTTLLFPRGACTLFLPESDCLASSHYPDHTQAQERSGEQHSPQEAGRRDSPSSPLSDSSLPCSRALRHTSPCAAAGGGGAEKMHTPEGSLTLLPAWSMRCSVPATSVPSAAMRLITVAYIAGANGPACPAAPGA